MEDLAVDLGGRALVEGGEAQHGVLAESRSRVVPLLIGTRFCSHSVRTPSSSWAGSLSSLPLAASCAWMPSIWKFSCWICSRSGTFWPSCAVRRLSRSFCSPRIRRGISGSLVHTVSSDGNSAALSLSRSASKRACLARSRRSRRGRDATFSVSFGTASLGPNACCRPPDADEGAGEQIVEAVPALASRDEDPPLGDHLLNRRQRPRKAAHAAGDVTRPLMGRDRKSDGSWGPGHVARLVPHRPPCVSGRWASESASHRQTATASPFSTASAFFWPGFQRPQPLRMAAHTGPAAT